MDYKEIFSKVIKEYGKDFEKYSLQIFNLLKPIINERMLKIIESLKKTNKGPKLKTDLLNFLDAVFYLVDNGSKFVYIRKHYGIPKTTFSRYFALLKNHCIIENLYKEITDSEKQPNMLIMDTFIVKSVDGKEGLGNNPTDRGRKGLKNFLVCDERGTIYKHHIAAANKGETTVLKEAITKPFSKRVRILADSGYVGKEVYNHYSKLNIRLIVNPRITSITNTVSGNQIKKNSKDFRDNKNNKNIVTIKKSHKLSYRDKKELKTKRNTIERVNSTLRRFRGVNVKFVKRISSYKCLLSVAILCVGCYNLFVAYT